ncbi:WD40 repeat domain-containing protein [Leisingera caerulea]|uniref:WD40 repeat domain-containing protein n=1 Tax=Leisingera caerulea TaxID=506591 RepID=UPI0021A40D74|nr:WD40 repeat domain-containing protein [Leisingera caerulea]UWQ49919.1 WD40 repeat domain-containing protein [Leisingera caerulea]
MIGHVGPISGVAAFGTNRVATAGYDNRLILWQLNGQQGAPVACAQAHHDHLTNSCQFSQAGDLLVSASSDCSARIWSVPDLRLQAVLTDHNDDVEMATFSPDDQHIATASRDYKGRVFDRAGRLLCELVGHERDVLSITWTRDGRRLVTSGDDGTVREWDADSGTEIKTYDLSGAETDTIAITPDAALLAGDDRGVINILSGGQRTEVDAHQSGIKRLTLSDDGSRLISISYDRTVRLWTVNDKTLHPLRNGSIPDIVWPRSAAFLDEDRVVFGTFGSSFATWQSSDDHWACNHVIADKSLNAACFIDNDLYTIGDAGRLYKNNELISDLGSLCNFATPFAATVITGGQSGTVFDGLQGAAIYSNDSPLNCAVVARWCGIETVFVGTYSGDALLVQRDRAGVSVVGRVSLHDNAIKGLAANSDTLFSVCATGAVAFHDLSDLKLKRLADPGHDKIANGAVVIDGGFASVGRDKMLRIWLESGDIAVETPHQNSIKCISANSSGHTLLTGSYTGWIAEFDLTQGVWTRYFKLSTSGVACICYNARTGQFHAVTYDGMVHGV